MVCKIKVVRDVEDIFPKYRPEVGKTYDAELNDGHKRSAYDRRYNVPFCVITVNNRRIVLREKEYEIVGG